MNDRRVIMCDTVGPVADDADQNCSVCHGAGWHYETATPFGTREQLRCICVDRMRARNLLDKLRDWSRTQ